MMLAGGGMRSIAFHHARVNALSNACKARSDCGWMSPRCMKAGPNGTIRKVGKRNSTGAGARSWTATRRPHHAQAQSSKDGGEGQCGA